MFKRPEPLMFAHPVSFALDHLLFNKERMMEDPEKADNDFRNPTNGPMLLGFAIPFFQRALVWDVDQQRNLIHSIWMNIPIGTYSVNFTTGKDLPPRLRNILIDGQQRLEALRAYWDDEFKYRGYNWSQLSDRDQRHFVSTTFPQMRTDSESEDDVRTYYNAMNFGGVAHKEGERA